MSEEVIDTTITTFQGDSFSVIFTDLEEGHLIGFEIRDKKTNKPVFDELRTYVNEAGEAVFRITPEMSNHFVVKPSLGVNTYYYGIKDINEETGAENTILLGDNPQFSDLYLVQVYLKKAEGIIENND